MTYGPPPVDPACYIADARRVECVTTCVGFDEILDVTLTLNHPHVDTMIVVTSHADRKTQQVAAKHGATCVQTDLFSKNGRKFNKGAAINAGFNRFHYYGWRLHLDADIALPDNFNRLLFNHTHLDRNCIYGADRMDIIGQESIRRLLHGLTPNKPQHHQGYFVDPIGHLSPRYLDHLHGYVPIGFFQMWHASCQKAYPHSLGTAAHDDVMFASSWPENCRRLLPSVVCYHLCENTPYLGQHWEGKA